MIWADEVGIWADEAVPVSFKRREFIETEKTVELHKIIKTAGCRLLDICLRSNNQKGGTAGARQLMINGLWVMIFSEATCCRSTSHSNADFLFAKVRGGQARR
jgi:hypothetical protein